jgi:glycosyltransferase involved in cell wall biosynthesis
VKKTPIKTLHVTNAYHQASGGIGVFYRNLLKAANEHERFASLVVPAAETRVEEIGKFARIFHVKARRAMFGDSRYRLILPSQYLFSDSTALRQILLQEQPDLIEICDKYALNWLAGLIRKGFIKGLRRPVLVGLSCERMDDNVRAYIGRGDFFRKLAGMYMGTCYIPMFDYHIANSEYTAAELRQAMRRKHQREIFVCPPGAGFEHLENAERTLENREHLLNRISGTHKTALLLYVGRLSKEKNIPLLVDMMKSLSYDVSKDYHLLIAGDGPLASWLADEGMKKAHRRLSLLGHIGDAAVLANLYANCDAFVHPNPREPFGIAPLEAMAANLPLVAPDAGGVLSYANSTNAWLGHADGESFADSVRLLFADAQKREQKIIRARQTAQKYKWTAVMAKLFALYDEMYEKFPTLPFAQKA